MNRLHRIVLLACTLVGAGLATPSFADREWSDRGDHHWKHRHHQRHHHDRHHDRKVVVIREPSVAYLPPPMYYAPPVYYPAPVYYRAPRPGIRITTPDIFIGF